MDLLKRIICKGVKKVVKRGVENLQDKQKIIIDLIRQNHSISKKQQELQENLSKKSIEYNIKKIKEMGLIDFGPAKCGH